MRAWLAEPMPGDVKEAVERARLLPDVARVAVMPDVHLGEEVCVGVVLATRSRVYPAAVGGDIGCGITAAPLVGDAGALDDPRVLREVLARLREAVPILRHRSLAESPAPPLDPGGLSHPALAAEAVRLGRVEFGTLGRGNHFLEVQRDQEGGAWIMVHSGSRAMGQAITRRALGAASRGARGVAWLDAEGEEGSRYLGDVSWACRYAAASRIQMARSAGGVLMELCGLAVDEQQLVDCNHNHVRTETHFGSALLVHRKGASPAAAGEAGLIPGAMGRESFHVTGRGEVEALLSSSHGAGRAMSRTEARRAVSLKRLSEDAGGVVFDERIGESLREEAASAYKDIRAVMRAQKELVKITRAVRGVLCYKGV
jgi:tRNA-splicing ligase RtcB